MAQRSESRVKISCTLPSKQAIMKQRLIMAEQSHTLWYFPPFFRKSLLKQEIFLISSVNHLIAIFCKDFRRLEKKLSL